MRLKSKKVSNVKIDSVISLYIPIIKFVTTSLGVRYHLVITSYRAEMVRLLRFYTCSKNLDFIP